ncbi:unnamed protein product [Schistosoma mattheei]|uniref:Uncharacterized protein n=2 Tax=Schistosoma TaxID=6181 RepID=A0A183NQ17_9TREM|nr:unnamed protein product [Schistosoma mattheei]
MRHTAARLRNSEIGSTVSESICPMGGRCRVEGPGRGKCPHCRYRKCLELGMTLTRKFLSFYTYIYIYKLYLFHVLYKYCLNKVRTVIGL